MPDYSIHNEVRALLGWECIGIDPPVATIPPGMSRVRQRPRFGAKKAMRRFRKYLARITTPDPAIYVEYMRATMPGSFDHYYALQRTRKQRRRKAG